MFISQLSKEVWYLKEIPQFEICKPDKTKPNLPNFICYLSTTS